MWQTAVWCGIALIAAFGARAASAQSTVTWRPLGSYSGSNTWSTSTSGTYWFNGSTYDYWSSTSNTAAFGNSSTTGTTVLVSGSVGAAGLIFNTLSVGSINPGATFALTGGTIGLGTGAKILVGGSTSAYGSNFRPNTVASTLSGSNATIDRVAGSTAIGGLRLTGNNTSLTGTMTIAGPVYVSANASGIQNISTINFTNSSAGIDLDVGTYSQNFILSGTNLRTWNSVTYAGTITLAGNGGFTNNQNVVVTVNNGIGETGGSRNLTLQLGGTTVLLGQSTYTGTTILASQNRAPAVSTVLLDGGNDRLPTGTVIQMDTSNSAYGITLGGTYSGSSQASNQTIAGLNSAIGNGGNSFIRGGASATSTLTVNLASGTNAFFGTLGGTAANGNNLALTKSGAGTLTLNGANSYTGPTVVNGGVLLLNSGSLATSSSTTISTLLSSSGTVTIGNGATLSLNGRASQSAMTLASGSYNTATTVTLTGTTTANLRPGAMISGSGIALGTYVTRIISNSQFAINQGTSGTFSGQSITVDAANFTTAQTIAGLALSSGTGTVSLTNAGGGTSLTVNGAVTGSGMLAKAGNGTLTLLGASTFSGGTQIDNGTIILDGGDDRLLSSGTVSIGSATAMGKLVLGGTTTAVSQTLARLLTSGSGGSIVGGNASTSTLVVDLAAGSDTFAGIIGGAGTNENNLAFTKLGAGALTLSGSNSYGGLTTVSAGGLAVNGSLAGAVTVQSGATLGGSGTIEGAVSILGGGIIAPGNSPATLTVNDVFTLADTSILEFELNGADMTIGGGVNDLIAGVTDLTLDGVLNVTALAPFTSATVGMKWRLFSYSGSLVDNTLALGTMPTLSAGNSFSIDTSEAGQVNLVIVPEPAGLLIAAVGISLTGIAFARRKRITTDDRRG